MAQHGAQAAVAAGALAGDRLSGGSDGASAAPGGGRARTPLLAGLLGNRGAARVTPALLAPAAAPPDVEAPEQSPLADSGGAVDGDGVRSEPLEESPTRKARAVQRVRVPCAHV
jgi:hypothetical protein